MKGMHNTIDGWHFDRNSYGWKLRGKHLQAILEERFRISELCRDDNVENAGSVRGEKAPSDFRKGDLEEPSKVHPVERLLSNVKALVKLTAPSIPPRVKLRAQDVLQVLYLPGNSSGAGFGSAIINKDGVMYESGTWSSEWAE